MGAAPAGVGARSRAFNLKLCVGSPTRSGQPRGIRQPGAAGSAQTVCPTLKRRLTLDVTARVTRIGRAEPQTRRASRGPAYPGLVKSAAPSLPPCRRSQHPPGGLIEIPSLPAAGQFGHVVRSNDRARVGGGKRDVKKASGEIEDVSGLSQSASRIEPLFPKEQVPASIPSARPISRRIFVWKSGRRR